MNEPRPPDPRGRVDAALVAAAAAGDLERLRAALAAGAAVDARDAGGWTPLLHAARAGHTAAVEALLAAGADPWRPGPAPPHGDWLPLLHANAGDHVAAAVVLGRAMGARAPDDAHRAWLTAALPQAADASRAWALGLLAAGADPHGPAGDGFPLIMAIQAQEPEIVLGLLAAGADPDRPCAGTTPLVHAAGNDDPDIVWLLLAAGADPRQRDGGGRTPLQSAAGPGTARATAAQRAATRRLVQEALTTWEPTGAGPRPTRPR